MEKSGVGTVIDPLLTLERLELSGVLEFDARDVKTSIYVRQGDLVDADAGTLGETLGRMLIRSGRLTEEQVAAVIRKMTDSIIDNENVRFGEVVVEYGFLTFDELKLALKQQVSEKVIGCIHRGAGKWTFSKDDRRLEGAGSYAIAVRPILVEAARHFPERRIEELLHLHEDRYPEILAPEEVIAEEFELDDEEAEFVPMLNGTMSLHAVLAKPSVIDAAQLITALVLGGGVVLHTKPTGASANVARSIPPEFRSTKKQKKFELPKIEEKTVSVVVSPIALAAEAAAAKRTPHSSPTLAIAQPSAPRRPSREGIAAPSNADLERARAAHDRLRNDLDARKPVSKRKRWPEPKDDKERRLMAAAAFHQGRVHLRAEEAERALPGLSRAHELRPDEREYELYVKWAKMLVNDSFKNDPERIGIEKLAATLVKENRECELGYSILGHCAMHAGKDDAALRFFQRAASLDPKLVDAARLARLLAMRASGKPKKPPPKDAKEAKEEKAARAKAGGLLATPIDEIVPAVLQKAQTLLADIIRRGSMVANEEMTREVRMPSDDTAAVAIDAVGLGELTSRTAAIVMEPPQVTTQRGLGSGLGIGAEVTAVSPQPEIPAPPPLLKSTLMMTPSPAAAAVPTAASVPGAAHRSRPRHIATVAGVAPPAGLNLGPPPVAPETPPPAPPSLPPVPLSLPPTELKPPPAPSRAPAPWRPESTPPTPQGSLPPPPPVPIMAMQQQQQQQTPSMPMTMPSGPPPPMYVSSAPIPAVHHAPSYAPKVMVSEEHQQYQTAQKRKSRTPLIIVGLILALGLTAAAVVFVIKEDPPVTAKTEPSSSAATTSSASAPIAVRTVVSSQATVQPSAEPPPPSTPPKPSVAAVSSAPTPTGKTATHGTLRASKARGHRIYVDGHIVGEGGKDMSVPCGVHRIRVGSHGTERVHTIACGEVTEVE